MANIKFSGFTAAGGGFTPSRTNTYFVGYDNSGGPDNIRLVTSDIESLLNWPDYKIALDSSTTNPSLLFTQPTGYSYGTTTGTLKFTAGSNVSIIRQSDSELVINSTDTNYTYSLATAADGSDIDVDLTGAGGGSNSSYKVTAGANVTLTPNGTSGYQISSSDTNTTSLPIKNGGGGTEFTATDTTGLRIVGGGSVTASYIPGIQQVSLTGTDTNTTYTLKSSDNGSNEMRIFLEDNSSVVSGETFIEPGSNITITETSSGSGRFVISAASTTSWTQKGDSGANNNINSGDSVDFAGGTYISTVSTASASGGILTINHDSTSRTDTTSSDSIDNGGNFTAIDTVTTNASGHVTAANVKTITLPDYTYSANGTSDPNLRLSDGTTSQDIQLVGGSNVNINNSGNVITIDSTGGGGSGSITGVTATTPLTGGGTTGNVTVGIQQADTSQSGFLSDTDWNIFNSKTSNTGTVTQVQATSPLTGGTITNSGTIGITQATTSDDGFLTASNWNTFNNKSDFSGAYADLTGKPTIPTVNDGQLTITVNGTPTTFTANQSGNSSVSITTGSGSGTVTEVTANNPLSVTSGTTTPDLSIAQADSTTDGYLTSGNWTTFNSKSDFSGAYADLTGKPTIPTNNNELSNGAGYITSASLPTVNDGELTITVDGTATTFTANQSGNSSVSITTGSSDNFYVTGASYSSGTLTLTRNGGLSDVIATGFLQIGTSSTTALAGDTTTITTAQANEITANTAKVGITTAQANEITANTAKVGITTAQANEITANTAKVGITTQQASDITTNNSKVTFPGFGTTAGTALEGDTAIPAAANNSLITLAAGTNMTGGGQFNLDQAGAQTITFNASGGSSGNLDLSNIDATSIKADLALSSQTQYGQAITLKALGAISNGDPVIWDYTSGVVKAEVPQSTFTQQQAIGVALEDIANGFTGDILISGFATVKFDGITTPFTGSEVVLDNSTNGSIITLDSSYIPFRATSGGTGSYPSSAGPWTIKFDAGAGNTVKFEIVDFGFEHSSTSLYDRGGWVVSATQNGTYNNAQLTPGRNLSGTDGWLNSATSNVGSNVWSTSYGSSSATSGYIFPEDPTTGNVDIGDIYDLGSRFAEYHFTSDGSSNYIGWDLKMISSGANLTGLSVGSTMRADVNSGTFNRLTAGPGGPIFGYFVGGSTANNAIVCRIAPPRPVS